MTETLKLALPDLEATRRLAEQIAAEIRAPMTIALKGTLGAGKTQFVRFFAHALGVSEEEVTSPTYVLLQRYSGEQLIYHFDWYRLETEDQVWDLGIDELYEQPNIVMIEWPDRFPSCLPEDYLEVEIAVEQGTRFAHVHATGNKSKILVNSISG